ncbi:NUDIX domain-containing protein [Paenibacillus lautus]|uniref:NUDIX domain-containing protein n=1 Tax=Paenibacillus lautus TaxID=1401 RepID=UPI003D2A295C
MKIRTMTGSFLFYNDSVLMLKRSENKKIAPGLWACIGGHVEADEYINPEISCLREISTTNTGFQKMSRDKNMVPLKVAIIAAFLFYRYKFLSRAKDKNLYRLP